MTNNSINDGWYSEKYYSTHLPRYEPMWKLISQYLNTTHHLRILDFGTGPGYNSVYIKKNFPQHEVVAGDISIPLEIQKKLKGSGIEVLENIRMEPKIGLPLDSNSFDIVVFFEVLEHIIDDPMHVFSEISRILKNGGYLFLTTPNIAQLFNRLMLFVGKQPQHYISSIKHGFKSKRGHFREWTANELVYLSRDLFEIEKCDYIDTYGTQGMVKESKLLKLLYNPYKLICTIKPSFRSTIVMVCQKK